MRGAAPRTIYESSARRARRRSRRLFAAALAVLVLAAAGGTAALVLWRDGGAQAGPRPAALTPSAPAAAPRTTALSSVEVRRGEQTRLRYRIDGAVDDTWTATLLVLAKDGGQVKAQRLGTSVPAGRSARTVTAWTAAARSRACTPTRPSRARASSRRCCSSPTCALGPRRTRRSTCLLYTSPSPRDGLLSRMPSSA